jgi:hypothetical protein
MVKRMTGSVKTRVENLDAGQERTGEERMGLEWRIEK